MKEQTLVEMKNKIEMLGGLIQQVIQEMSNLKDLSIGTLETVKKMPGYKEAIDELIEESKKNKKDK